MKKKIANAVQLVLLIVSFILLNLESITRVPNENALISYTTSIIDRIESSPILSVPMYVLYVLCAAMCIISIVSKSTYKDGKAHGVVAVFLFIDVVYNVIACTSGDQLIIDHNFPVAIFIGVMFAIVVVAFAKRSSLIADTLNKEEKQTVVNNIQETTNADELKKYKDLLDSGAITQEEFENKKKELLGL